MDAEPTLLSRSPEKPPHLFRFPALFLFLGAIWPLLTIAFELLTRACAQSFFDPFPTAWHVLLALTVPLGNGLAWWIGNGPPTRYMRWISAVRGAAWVCGVFFLLALGLLSFVALPMAVFGVLMIFREPLIALLPLAAAGPLAGVVMLARSAFALQQASLVAPDHGSIFKSHRGARWAGALAALAIWGMAEIPILITANLGLATADDAAEGTQIASVAVAGGSSDPLRAAAVARSAGSKEVLRMMCREGGSAFNFSPALTALHGPLLGFSSRDRRANARQVDVAREVFYRAFGETYDSRPGRMTREGLIPLETNVGRARNGTIGFLWDADAGGDAVGPKIPGLSMHASRLDWHLDEPSRLAYGEWTIEFKNLQSNAQEARCQMLLPPRGVVSRLTLWIDGEEREAAFGAKAQVKAAYREVVQVQRRDPVMVNMIGPDLVMVQCFPVPPAGVMKIRLGIIAPLGPEAAGLVMPRIISRNFVAPRELAHAIWVQSPSAFVTPDGQRAESSSGPATWQGSAGHESLASFSIQLPGLKEPPPVVWTEDPFASPETRFLVREPGSAPQNEAAGLILVVDTSACMEPHREQIAAALDQAPPRLRTVVLTEETKAGFRELPAKDAAGHLRASRFMGGMDGAPALHHACEIAARREEKTIVLWLHGAQPLAFASTTPLLDQFLERSPRVPEIRSVQLVAGRDVLLEHLYQQANVTASRFDLSRSATAAGSLWSLAGAHQPAGCYSHQASAPDATATRVWSHLARYAAFEKVLADFKGSHRSENDLAAHAARYQIVTPVSSAVVLETKQQYDRAGLKPVDPSTTPGIPAVPEPGSSWLVMIALALATFARRRRTAG